MRLDAAQYQGQPQVDDAFVREDLEQMTQAPNYLNYQFSFVRPHLGRRILEVGTGIGNFTELMLPNAESLVGLEPNPVCLTELRARLGHWSSLQTLGLGIEEVEPGRFQKYRLDTVVCMNVLEHVADDYGAVRRFADVLPVGGRLILVVPAIPWAYGPIDRAVGHYRRYSKRRLLDIVRGAGFGLRRCRYYNPIGLLGWIYNTRAAKIQRQSDIQIRVFDRFVVPVQRRVERLLSMPIGQSLVVVADKAGS